MAKWRAIHKKISRSGQVNRMSEFAQFLFERAMLHADDWGIMSGDPLEVKAQAMPLNPRPEEEFDAALAEMENVGLIWRYHPDGCEPLIQFITFDEHQPKVLIGNRSDPKLPLHHDHPNYNDYPELQWNSLEKAANNCKTLERERKHSQSKSYSKSKSSERDSRLDHEAIKGYRHIARLNVPIALRDDWIACAEEVGIERLLATVKEWMAKGHRPQNVAGMMEVARGGWKYGAHQRSKHQRTFSADAERIAREREASEQAQ